MKLKEESIHKRGCLLFAPQQIETGQSERRQILLEFQCTRLKLLNILRRHDRIDSILREVQTRVGPMQLQLSLAAAKTQLVKASAKQLEQQLDRAEQSSRRQSTQAASHKVKEEPLGELQEQGNRFYQLANGRPARSVSSYALKERSPGELDWMSLLEDLNEWCNQMDKASLPATSQEANNLDTEANTQ